MARSVWRICAVSFAVIGSIAVAVPPARADFRICNDSLADDFIAVAIGYSDNGIWVSEGWWEVGWDECVTVVFGDLRNRYYYIRGEGDFGGLWEDDYVFCVDPRNEFEIRGDHNCGARGFASAGFFEVDVGNAVDWSIELAD